LPAGDEQPVLVDESIAIRVLHFDSRGFLEALMREIKTGPVDDNLKLIGKSIGDARRKKRNSCER
jgi:hypothetical protein